MTTIAWDGVTIAHDSQSTAGSLIMANQQKSFVLDAVIGFLFAASWLY